MHAEILSIGDELASGARLDTNSQWLSQQLGELGIRVLFHTTVGDDMASNIEVFRNAARRADLVLCTGGLGPTADDLTRQAMSEAFGLPLVLNEESMAHIERLFAKRKRPMPDRNRIQAMFPQGCRVVPNPHGSAPGIDLEVGSPEGRPSRLIALPGVPAEMKEMWDGTVRERLCQDYGLGQAKIFYRTLKMYGIGESDVEAKIPDLIERDREPRVGITVSRATISLRMATHASREEEALMAFEGTEKLVRETFGSLVFGVGDTYELQHAVLDALNGAGQTVSVLEVGPSALLATALRTADVGLEPRVVGNLVMGTSEAVGKWASRQAILNGSDSESREARSEAAMWLAALHASMPADWCLVMGPYPLLSREVVASGSMHPFVVAMRSPTGEVLERHWEYGGHPDILHHRMAKTALDQLRRTILGLE